MQFSVKWAAAAPAYVGMLTGIAILLWKAATPLRAMGAVAFGMFMGGAVGLPACAANLLAATGVRLFMDGRPFVQQFAAFALAAVAANILLLWALHHAFRPMGGMIHKPADLTRFFAFVAASVGLAFCLMALWPASPH